MRDASPAQCRWWSEKDPSGLLFTTVTALDRQDGWRRSSLLSAYRFYGDTPIKGFGPGGNVQVDSSTPPLSYNVIRSITDTVHAETVQASPKAMFATTGAGWEMRQRAEKLTQFVEGVEYEQDFESTADAICRDAILFGNATLKVFDEDGEVCIERVLPGELFVDAYDAREGKPRTLYQVKHVDRSVLLARYPEMASEIGAARSDVEWMRARGFDETSTDLVVVIEAWHLKSTKKSTDGRHTIAVSSGVLFDEEWKEKGFPFEILRWSSPPLGFWTTGAAEQLAGLQYEINALLDKIREHQDHFGAGFFLCEEGSEPHGHDYDEIGRVVTYKRNHAPPTVIQPVVVSRDTYEQLDRYFSKAYEIFGVSAMSAQAVKPVGVDSGKAMRTLANIQSKRFVAFGKAWERFHVNVAKLIVRCARRIGEDDPSYSVVYDDGETVERIEWSECDLDDDEFVVRAYPVSSLQGTPAEQLATANDMLMNGAITPVEWARLINRPDLKAAMSLNDAPHDLVEKLLSKMVIRNQYIAPEPFFNLAMCFEVGTKAYNKAVLDEVPEARLELIRKWLVQTKFLMKQEAAKNAPPPAPVGPMPDAPPMPPPGGDVPLGAAA